MTAPGAKEQRGAQQAALQGWGSQRREQKGGSWCCPAALGLDSEVLYPTMSKQVLFLRNQTLCIQEPGARSLH